MFILISMSCWGPKSRLLPGPHVLDTAPFVAEALCICHLGETHSQLLSTPNSIQVNRKSLFQEPSGCAAFAGALLGKLRDARGGGLLKAGPAQVK